MKEIICKRDEQNSIDIDYLIYKPDSYEKNSEEQYPLIVFLHGGSVEENAFETLKEKGVNQYLASGNELESVVICPLHHYPEKFWNEQTVMSIIKSAISSNRIDVHQINIMGVSRGGYAAWRLAIEHPDFWSSCVVAGGASAPFVYAFRIPTLPVWAFHGAKDEIVPENGNSNVPAKYKTESGYSLGRWVSKQRSNRDKLPSKKKDRLEQLGFIWDLKRDCDEPS